MDIKAGWRACSPEDLAAALRGGGQVIDVREPAEVATEMIGGLRSTPLSAFDSHVDLLDREQPVYIVCRSGRRAETAAERLIALGHRDVRVLSGGVTQWAAAGLPVERGASSVWSLERQVRFAAGLFVLAGVLLATLAHPGFIALSGFVGAGLVFAAVSDTCAMAVVLARMPWNQRAGKSCASPSR